MSKSRLFIPLLFSGWFVLSLLILMVERGERPVQMEFLVNEPAPRTVFSPLRLTLVNDGETARLQEEAAAKVLPVFTLDPKVKSDVISQSNEALKKFVPTAGTEKGPVEGEEVSKALAILFEGFLKEGLLEDAKKKELLGSGRAQIVRWDPEARTESTVEVKNIKALSEAKGDAFSVLERGGIKDRSVRDNAVEIFKGGAQSNLIYDEARTRERIKRAAESVAPVIEELKKGEMIAQKGLLVTEKQQKWLTQLQKKMAAREVQNRLLAVSIFVFLSLSFCYLYLKQFERKSLASPRFLALVSSVFLLTLTVEKISQLVPNASLYLLPGALAAVLLTILWNPTVGILAALVTPVLSAPLAEFRLELVLMIFMGSLAGAFAARRIRKRIHFLKAGLAVGAVNSAVLFAFFASQEWRFTEALNLSSLGLANGFLVMALAFFLAPLFESLFNLATDITLLELSDLNHPLLKRMVVEAPGTYHHSLVVSTLAEAACQAIGANSLLARVGCYFHDIGKIARSEYFTENQNPQTGDRHVKLTPTMSCLVIMNHVKDGVELARKHKLKNVIIQFIREHQGKGVIYYFYRKAMDQAVPGEEVSAEDFRYAGPKPQSRETAVAMLADSVEATSRSLKEVTPASIRTLVRKIINEKFIDGQLDECDLTLKDLHKIQESFVHNLLAIFHTRVTYPVVPADPKRPDLFAEDQFKKFH